MNIFDFTYGTTPFETFKKVIDEVKKPKRFVVLGSSIGWQCFFWNSLFPDIPIIGVVPAPCNNYWATSAGVRQEVAA